jgi:GNAT superfamily N-acetyltransferase
VRPGEQLVLGYYALTNHRVVYEALPPTESKGLPKIDVPVVLLGRLAVDVSVQGRGLGALLLVDALRRILEVADEVGVRAVEVDAIDDDARRFYEKFGFRSLLDDPRHLFMPLQAVRRLKFS